MKEIQSISLEIGILIVAYLFSLKFKYNHPWPTYPISDFLFTLTSNL